MEALGLVLFLAYVVLAFGLRSVLQRRRTGSTGFHGISGRPGSVEWFAGVGFVVALVLGAAAPALALAGVVEPIDALDSAALNVLGAVLAVAGILASLAAQVAMGSSWRIGVAEGERTTLVTTGPFALVRNPFFAALVPTALGLTLMVPSWVALAALAATFLAIELQVRIVEEPYLRQTHGADYATYAARVGRFVPGVGRLAAPPALQREAL
jgi:protein-S-isoprenylcysteine O-methyltransferase Ste14